MAPLWEVTTIDMAFEPTLSDTDLATAEVAAAPPIVIVASVSERVAVTFIEEVPLETVAVYEVVPVAKVGESVPDEIDSAESVFVVEAAVRVIVNV